MGNNASKFVVTDDRIRTTNRLYPLVVAFCCCLLISNPEAAPKSDPLILGVFPRRNMQVTQKIFTPLAEYLSRKLSRPVKLETTHDFASFWDQVKRKRYDIVHYNQYHYLRSHKEFGYQVIAKNEEFGLSKIAGAILVRTDSGINSLQDLKGKKVVFGGGRLAMQAYISASYLLREAGLKPGDYFEQFALNPPKAAIATYYHQAAAAGTGDHVLQLPQVTSQIDTTKMRYLATTKPIAHLPWAVKPGMPKKQAMQIKNLLCGLHDTPEGRKILQTLRLTNILPANDSEYNDHRRIIKAVLNEQM
jgi:phosphonate transport system substrate-binding protein